MESMLVRIDSTSNWLRPINLLAKRAGERSAGNLHAPFDVAGNGNQLTVRLVRHSQRKRRATDRSDLRSMAPFVDATTSAFSALGKRTGLEVHLFERGGKPTRMRKTEEPISFH